MCGIAGGWWRTSVKDGALKVASAMQEIAHRGPDDHGQIGYQFGDGEVHLGHVRLAILDLSRAGHQPMQSGDGRLSVVYNGEIYNYKELRGELERNGYRFTTQSDTEVLLNAWLCWGERCLSRFEGMFAFCMLDRQSRSLVLARDPFGIKPLFYAWQHRNLFFSSEVGALCQLMPERPDLNWQRCYDYLVHGQYDSSTETFNAEISHLLPGHLLRLSLSNPDDICVEKWWSPRLQQGQLSFSQAVEATRENFLQNIRSHLRSDVPIGAALSGGIDSSAIVCGMRYIDKHLPINTFSYISADSKTSEEKWVDIVNQHVGANVCKVRIDSGDLFNDMDALIKAQGEPFGSTTIYAQFRVFQAARECGVTVTLDGQGGDELLGGYDGYPGHRLLSLLEQRNYVGAGRFMRHWANVAGSNSVQALAHLAHIKLPANFYKLARGLSGRSFTPSWLDVNLLADAHVRLEGTRPIMLDDLKGRRVIEKLAHALQCHGLPHLLRHGDRNSMHFSIESRVPFLTTSLADLCLSFPEDYLVSPQAETKSVFRAAMRGIVPDAILDRQDKVGFATPELQWLKRLQPELPQLMDTLGRVPFVRSGQVASELNAIFSGSKAFSWQAWRWINFAKWLQISDYAAS